MERVTRKILAKRFADKVERKSRSGYHGMSYDWAAKWEEVRKLGPEPDPDKVDEILGTGVWTACYCCVCGEDVEEACEVKMKRGGVMTNQLVTFCLPCCLKMFLLLDSER